MFVFLYSFESYMILMAGLRNGGLQGIFDYSIIIKFFINYLDLAKASVNKENVPRQQEKNFFFRRHLRIISKLGKLHIIQQAAGCFDDVFTLLWGLLHFPRQEKTTSTCHLLRHKSYHQSHTISPLPGLGRRKNDRQLNLRIWGTA